MAKTTELKPVDEGAAIADDIRRGVQQRDAKSERWALNKAYYFNDPPERADKDVFEGASDFHFNLTQVFCDALGGWVVGTLTSQEPYCVPSTRGTSGTEDDDVVSVVQNAVWKRLKQARFRRHLRKASQPAGWANAGIVWLSWEKGKGLCVQVIDPRRFVVYPSSRGIADCVLYGRSFDRTRGEIRKLIKDGYYKGDVDKLGASGGQSRKEQETHPGINDTVPYQTASRPEEELIELWEVVRRDPADGSTKIYTVHEDSGTVLKESVFGALSESGTVTPYKHQCAFVFRYKEEATDEFWHQGSVAQDVQGLQTAVNEAMNVYMDGMHMASFGAVFAEPGSAGSSKLVKFGPGSVNREAGLSDAKFFTPSVDVGTCLPLINTCMQHAQIVVRLSSLGAGGALKQGSNVTAREIDAAQAGQNTGVEDYVDTFSDDLPALFAHAQELIYHYDEEARSDAQVYSALAKDYDWNVQVVSPSETPGSQMAALLSLVQMAQDPTTGLKKREIVTRFLRLLERRGVTDASGLQTPANADEIVQEAAEALGVDSKILAVLVAKAMAVDHEERQHQAGLLQNGAPQPGPGMGEAPGGGFLSQLGGGQSPLEGEGTFGPAA